MMRTHATIYAIVTTHYLKCTLVVKEDKEKEWRETEKVSESSNKQMEEVMEKQKDVGKGGGNEREGEVWKEREHSG